MDTARSAREGNALVLALVMVSIIASVGMVFLRISTSIARRQSNDADQVRAFYLAEAGLAEAFQAVRIGRTGQMASRERPARYGAGGLLWVDATKTVDAQVRLVSNALAGRGHCSLSLVVEPVDLALGFYSVDDLVVDSTLLLDGYDSEERSYAEEVTAVGGEAGEESDPGPASASFPELALVIERVGLSTVLAELEWDNPSADRYLSSLGGLDHTQSHDLRDDWPAIESAFAAGTLLTDMGLDKNGEPLASEPVAEVSGGAPLSMLGATTGAGGLLSSGGDVRFANAEGTPIEVFGDVTPGLGGTLVANADVTITGATDARTTEVDLPSVDVPDLVLAGPVVHDDVLPLLLSGGAVGYQEIVVAADAELVLRGPVTAVLGQLVLEPGALLTIDTRDGDVLLFVQDGMDLQADSVVVTTGATPSQTTIEVGAIASDPSGPAVRLDATAQFHGRIYAPEADVRIGSSFEVYGGVIARKLTIGTGARLHFDNAGYANSPLPRIVAWKIVEVPSVLKKDERDYLASLEGEVLPELAAAHELDDVTLTIQYVDAAGTTCFWTGSEADFAWTDVDQILAVTRAATWELEGDAAGTAPVDVSPISPEEAAVLASIASLSGNALCTYLKTQTPLTDREFHAVIDAANMTSGQTQIIARDSTPLSDSSLVYMLKTPGALISSDLARALAFNCPLSADVLAVMEATDLMTDTDKQAIRDLQ